MKVPGPKNMPVSRCPFCGTNSQHIWTTLGTGGAGLPPIGHEHGMTIYSIMDYQAAQCVLCRNWSLWVREVMVYPQNCTAPLPSTDMPDSVRDVYLEARIIAEQSPRASAALLRLALQKLMIHLGQKGHKLDDDIQNLVKDGLSAKLQQALDSLRVIGNNAVHPGTIDITDDKETSINLFNVLNIIVEQMITNPRQIDVLYSKLPPSAIDAIDKRSKK